ncbi:MAG: class I SAM-dependent methyltransferase [Candidatus Sericytochromatia bacterium]|nr:class I SAM-dependent methyltransferase [Candidatus Tanganyikabacteria bacterium]
MQETIVDYWNVQPPFKASVGDEGSPEWYRSITDHRHRVVPYLADWARFNAYRGKRVLEIGCGAGTDLAEFARHGADVTGVDITDAAVELAKRRLAVEGLSGRVLKYPGNRLPFEAGSFDLVYSCGVLHHTPFMDDLLAEAHRVLVPGGQLRMMLYHRRSLLYYYSILYLRQHRAGRPDLDREAVLSRYSEFRTGCPYTRVFAPEEMSARLWYFDRVETAIDYPVYDTETDRKLPATDRPAVEPTGVPDVDAFFAEFAAAAAAGEDLRRFGWHLLVTATR